MEDQMKETEMKRTRFPETRPMRRTRFARPKDVEQRKSNLPVKPQPTYNEISATLEEITEECNTKEKIKLMKIQNEIEVRMYNIKRDTFEIGRLLSKGKKIVGHGNFQKWIETAFGNELPYSTAYMYMMIYKGFKDHEKAVGHLPLDFLYTMSQAKNPKEIKKLIAEKAEDITKETADEIKEVFDLFKKGKIMRTDYVKAINEMTKQGIERETKSTKHRITVPARHILYWGGSNILVQIQAMIDKAREMAHLYPYTADNPEHQKFMKEIKKTIQKLLKLRETLQNKGQFFDPHYEGNEFTYDRYEAKNNNGGQPNKPKFDHDGIELV